MLNPCVTCVVISSHPSLPPFWHLTCSISCYYPGNHGHGDIVVILGCLLLKEGDWISAPSLLCNPGLYFCWESSIVELPWGGRLSWLYADKGVCWPLKGLWGCSEGGCLTPPMLSRSFYRSLKPWFSYFFLLTLTVAGSSSLWVWR